MPVLCKQPHDSIITSNKDSMSNALYTSTYHYTFILQVTKYKSLSNIIIVSNINISITSLVEMCNILGGERSIYRNIKRGEVIINYLFLINEIIF